MINNVTSGSAGSTASLSSALSAGPGGKLGKDEFMKLLIAQMRNQDPMNPMKGEELAVQLAQFSSVEQLMNLNIAMGRQEGIQAALSEAINNSSAMGAIGRDVLAIGNQVAVPGAGTVTAVVGAGGGDATLRIFDANGKEVGTRALGNVSGGRQNIELGAAASQLGDGRYTYSIEVTDAKGGSVPVQTFTTGRVDGVRYGSNGPVLTAGSLEIPIGTVVEIVAAK